MDSARPRVRSTQSFTRMDPLPTPESPRKRANTAQGQGIQAVPAARSIATSPEMIGKPHVADVFENREENDHSEQNDAEKSGPELQLPSTFDELPIEIRSLTERFLESLSARVHPTPLTAEALSSLFQDFYERAAASIATHIASLSSRIGRDKSPAPANNGSKASVKGRARAGSGAKRAESSPTNSGGEMLTASEVADRRKARRLLELKRLALEEAVERAVCEKVYERVYKYERSDDDARDEKLRSRTAALALVGIGLKELQVDSPSNQDIRKATEEKEDDIHRALATAQEALRCMDDERYPLGKLQHLTAAHKSIVETLSEFFPSSSSADEILPSLIYTLINSPPEGINIVSNLNFIQRFRASNKVDGEAAYCLVNLEAAISFLETVDLSSLRADEPPEGPPKSMSSPSTPIFEKSAPFPDQAPAAHTLKPDVSHVSVNATEISSSTNEAVKALPSSRTPSGSSMSAIQQKRLSALMQAQADRIEAGRENFLNTADKIYDSINGTLENSLQFVFGRFKDQTSGGSPLPKTLEDARKLVSSSEEDDDLTISGRSSPAYDDPLTANGKTDNKVLEIIGGRKPVARDRSVDSARSGGSGKRGLFLNDQAAQRDQAKTDQAQSATAPGNLFTTMNPLNRFSVPGFARFGRSGSVTTPPAQPSPGLEKVNKLSDIVESPRNSESVERNDSNSASLPLEKTQTANEDAEGDNLNAREALAELRRLKPPKKRFLDVSSAGELKISEVDELLLEYRRLAKAIGEAVAM